MSEINTLYQDMIIDHGMRPRNFGASEKADHVETAHNPLCGDHVTLYVTVREGVIDKVTFEGSGCAISMASTSMMTEALVGKTPAEAQALFNTFHALMTEQKMDEGAQETLGKLKVLEGVAAYPMRIKCATLAWHAFKAALE